MPRDTVVVYFKVSSSIVDPAYRSNRQALDSLVEHLHNLRSKGVDSVEVKLFAGASPDGRYANNQVLAENRRQALWKYLNSIPDIPNLFFFNSSGVATWEQVGSNPLEDYRRCVIILVYSFNPEPPPAVTEPASEVEKDSLALAPVPVPSEPEPLALVEVPQKWTSSWYLKTNFLTYPLNLTPNIAAEFELGRHVSISVPIYYSPMNWFRSSTKFRVLGTQPEARYWFNKYFTRFFVGVHATFGWYNIAFGGQYRYQDHAATTPTFGGGVTGGYRLPLGKNNRWALEFTLGAGYLPLCYDTFYDIDNGAMAQESLRENYWGLDNAAVTLSYRFGKGREGR